MQASADSNKIPSIFQLIVGSKQTMKPQQDLIDFSLSKTISIARPSAQIHLVDRIFETSNGFDRRLIVTFIETKAKSKSREPETETKAESKSREPENEPKAKSKSREPGNETKAESYIASSFQYFSSYNFRLVVKFILIPHSEGEFYSSKSEGAKASIRQLIVTLIFEQSIEAFPIFQLIDVSVPDNTFADFQLVVELIPTLNSEEAQAPSSKLIAVIPKYPFTSAKIAEYFVRE
jgi:hypothetical protein